jgi:hypothetical protein
VWATTFRSNAQRAQGLLQACTAARTPAAVGVADSPGLRLLPLFVVLQKSGGQGGMRFALGHQAGLQRTLTARIASAIPGDGLQHQTPTCQNVSFCCSDMLFNRLIAEALTSFAYQSTRHAQHALFKTASTPKLLMKGINPASVKHACFLPRYSKQLLVFENANGAGSPIYGVIICRTRQSIRLRSVALCLLRRGRRG